MALLDRNATVADLKALSARVTAEHEWEQLHSPKELAIAVVTEAAELLQHFRFKTNDEIESFLEKRQNRTAVQDEISDVLFVVLRLSAQMHFDLSAAFERKLKKMARPYPINRRRAKSLKFNDRR
jgi:NTP pyrophosphatase (non-canonical NTP hydrolase)